MASGLGRGGRGTAMLDALKRLKDEEEKRKSAVTSQVTTSAPSLGRGSMMTKLQKKFEELRVSTPPPDEGTSFGPAREHVTQSTSSIAGTSQGNFPLRRPFSSELASASSETESASASAPKPVSLLLPTRPATRLGRGRGMLTKLASETGSVTSEVSASASASASLDQSTCTIRSEPITSRANHKIKVSVAVNYVRLNVTPGFGIFEYAVAFDPQIDHRNFRYKLVSSQYQVIGKILQFDGSTLYLPSKLPNAKTVLTASQPVDGSPVTIYVKFVKQRQPQDCVQFYNILFNRLMRILKYTSVQRKFYDDKAGIPIPKHKLEVWPGYVTAVNEYEGGLMIMCDVSHKVVRHLRVIEILRDKLSRPNGQAEVDRALIGNYVMTTYNNKTYRIDEIDWASDVTGTFTNHSGQEMTYLDYYKKQYNIDIRDKKQPLLIHRKKPPRGVAAAETELVCFVPELCVLTGLTDDMRSDYNVMKDIAAYTRLNPQQRQYSYRKFLENIQKSDQAQEELKKWGIAIATDYLELEGQVVPKESIFLGNGPFTVNQKCDWGKEVTSGKIFCPIEMKTWTVIYCKKNANQVFEFVKMMTNVCPAMGIKIGQPILEGLNDERTEHFLRAIQNCATQSAERTQIIVTICPSSRDDRYSAIKKKCYIELAIPSQVINARTISMSGKLRSVAQKIALQMNCKLGGELWAVDMPLKTSMIVGIDVYHDPSRKGQSVVGFVASMNDSKTRWHSRTIFQSSHQELIDGLKTCMIAVLKKHYDVRHTLPDKIFVYRDGVGDGQLKFVLEYEIEQLISSFSSFGENYKPMLTVVIVQKKIDTRIMECREGQLSNPRPGTVVDHTVTRYNYADFFLVSQHVNQGTVTPTHYIILKNDCNLKIENLQRLTYKLSHLYFNWPGTIRVPAPCQYAHRLAQLTGQHLHRNADDVMNDRLFFL